MKTVNENVNIVNEVESYINRYVALPEKHQSLPLTLWAIGTHCWPTFDAYAYLTICGVTKQSGKTRLGIDVMSQICANAETFSAKSAASIFRSIEEKHPTVLIDEAEILNSEADTEMREILNKGYRRGQTITKVQGKEVKTFETYCPKCFILIGDVNDTLRSRSILIWMRRGDTAERFTFRTAEAEGRNVRSQVSEQIQNNIGAIEEAYLNHKGLPYLNDRDEEIWLPLFALCQVFAPERLTELQAAAVDLSAEKTAEAKSFEDLRKYEGFEMQREFGVYLIRDMILVCGDNKGVATVDALELLKAIPTSPWRKFRGVGLTAHDIGSMLNVFGVENKNIRFGGNRNKSASGNVRKGYALVDLKAAYEKDKKGIDYRIEMLNEEQAKRTAKR